MLPSSILLLALATAGQSDANWEVVTSQEGQFTVEMPVKPNHSRSSTSNGPNGKVKINEIGCDLGEAAFIVVRIEDPVIIPRAAEEAYLDFTRDMYAAKFNGKVTSDKKVLLDKSAGRDFTIKAQKPGVGIINIRAREYLQGKAVFLLLAASEPNKDLPEETARFLGSFAFGIHPEGTTVKGDRRETEAAGKEMTGWGRWIDPDGDVKVKPSAKSLVMEIPGTLHDLVADIGKFNAPRAVRPVEGDFAMMVKVDGSFSPGGKSTKEKTVPLNTGGLLLWKDSDNYILLLRTAMLGKGGKLNTMVLFEEREGGHRGAMHNQGLPAGPLMLRMERKGTRITGSVSGDGVTWKPLKPMDTTWADGPVKVGLVATNTSSEPSTVKFDTFSLKTSR